MTEQLRIATVENSYTPNKELSQFFVRCINDYFDIYKEKKDLYDEINRYLTSTSGVAALNILSGQEIISAAAMFKVLRLVNDPSLTDRFIQNPMVLGDI